jgi:hypothetical protein
VVGGCGGGGPSYDCSGTTAPIKCSDIISTCCGNRTVHFCESGSPLNGVCQETTNLPCYNVPDYCGLIKDHNCAQ